MSRNSKNARLHKQAREHSARRKAGGKAAKVNSTKQKSKTSPGKKSYRTDEYGNPREDRRKSMGEFTASIRDRLEKRWGTAAAVI